LLSVSHFLSFFLSFSHFLSVTFLISFFPSRFPFNFLSHCILYFFLTYPFLPSVFLPRALCFCILVKHGNQLKQLTSTLSCQLSFYWIKVQRSNMYRLSWSHHQAIRSTNLRLLSRDSCTDQYILFFCVTLPLILVLFLPVSSHLVFLRSFRLFALFLTFCPLCLRLSRFLLVFLLPFFPSLSLSFFHTLSLPVFCLASLTLIFSLALLSFSAFFLSLHVSLSFLCHVSLFVFLIFVPLFFPCYISFCLPQFVPFSPSRFPSLPLSRFVSFPVLCVCLISLAEYQSFNFLYMQQYFCTERSPW
jgi:hypothetical protein